MINIQSQSRFLLASLWGVALVVLLAACDGAPKPTPGPKIEDQVSENQDIPELAPLPACPNNYNKPPEQVYPAEGDFVHDLQPEFVWTFPLECQPLGFYLRVGTIVDPQSDDVFAGETDGLLRTFSGVELLPATWHRWRVDAHLTQGASVNNGKFVSFLTGPFCDADQLVAPELIYPADGSIYTGKSWGNPYEVETVIVYLGGSCLPEFFTIYISIDPDFKGENWNLFSPGPGNVYTSNPEGLLLVEEGLLLVEDDSNDVLDCTTYYWRAWGMVGDTDGPVSETFSFFTNIGGNCFPYIKVPQDTNCRASDYTDSKNLATLFEGEEAEVLAVNPEGTHVLIQLPSVGPSCWVWLGLVDLMQGDMSIEPDQLLELVSIQDPATPTPTPVPPTDTPTPDPQCSDGVDNDGDGLTDFSASGVGDPQCRTASDNDELNP